MNNHILTIPVKGAYKLSLNAYKRMPTGRFEMQTNINRKWWQIWKPKMILSEVYDIIPIKDQNDMNHMIYLREGEVVCFNTVRLSK